MGEPIDGGELGCVSVGFGVVVVVVDLAAGLMGACFGVEGFVGDGFVVVGLGEGFVETGEGFVVGLVVLIGLEAFGTFDGDPFLVRGEVGFGLLALGVFRGEGLGVEGELTSPFTTSRQSRQ